MLPSPLRGGVGGGGTSRRGLPFHPTPIPSPSRGGGPVRARFTVRALLRPGTSPMLVTSALISGLGLGSMYGLLALGFYITYSVSSTVNFSQGSSMMLGAVFAYAFAVGLGWPLGLAAIASLLLCGAYGIVVELVGIRPFA